MSRAKLCINCLSKSRVLSRCTNNKRCPGCRQHHHTLLHFPPLADLVFSAVSKCTEAFLWDRVDSTPPCSNRQRPLVRVLFSEDSRASDALGRSDGRYVGLLPFKPYQNAAMVLGWSHQTFRMICRQSYSISGNIVSFRFIKFQVKRRQQVLINLFELLWNLC